jgi:hypothetical protein
MHAWTPVALAIPGWMQFVVAAVGVIVAFAFVWMKIILPFAKLVTEGQKFLPMLSDLPILREIIATLRSNSGSTLKDQLDRNEAAMIRLESAVERLEEGAAVTALALLKAAEDVRVKAEVIRQLAERDREVFGEIVRSGVRTEASGARREAEAADVAENLAAHQRRADSVPPSAPAGTAADVANRSPKDKP